MYFRTLSINIVLDYPSLQCACCFWVSTLGATEFGLAAAGISAALPLSKPGQLSDLATLAAIPLEEHFGLRRQRMLPTAIGLMPPDFLLPTFSLAPAK